MIEFGLTVLCFYVSVAVVQVFLVTSGRTMTARWQETLREARIIRTRLSPFGNVFFIPHAALLLGTSYIIMTTLYIIREVFAFLFVADK